MAKTHTKSLKSTNPELARKRAAAAYRTNLTRKGIVGREADYLVAEYTARCASYGGAGA